jgi:hypothetical protein
LARKSSLGKRNSWPACRATPKAFGVAERVNGWQAERLPYSDWSDIDKIFPSIDDHRFSDRVRDASIENWLLFDVAWVFITVRLDNKALGATDASGCSKSERIAIADSACVFAADIVGTETIAKGSSRK